MIFADVSVAALREMLTPCMGAAVWPGLEDKGVKAAACDYAKTSGLWDALAKEIDPASPITILRYQDYQDYFRTGRRHVYEHLFQQRLHRTNRATLAWWLDHPAADLDELQNLLWAWCESSWTYPAMEPCYIDLVSSMMGRTLAETKWLLRDRLEKRLQDRISHEIHQRLLQVALDWRSTDWWTTAGNNWNSVCNSNLIQTAFYEILDAWQLAAFVHPVTRRLQYALDYFTEDGGCPEGTGYWQYGFGHFLEAAIALSLRTGGGANITGDAKIQRICGFPLATHLHGRYWATFADDAGGYLDAQTVLKINHFFPMPELFALTEPDSHGLMKMADIRTLALYRGEKLGRSARVPPSEDRFLSQLGYAKVYVGDAVLAAVGGRNDVSHNHNDIGSFMFVSGGSLWLTDPGAPVYTSKTFSSQRYEILVCRGRGHSVPTINGHEQAAGSQYQGIIELAGLNASAIKTIRIDMTRAYPDAALLQLFRELTIDSSGMLTLRDIFRFRTPPSALEEAFITFESAALTDNGVQVLLGEPGQQARLQSLVPGRFAIDEFSSAQHEGRDSRPLRRITFVPRSLTAEMILTFQCAPQRS